MRLSQLPTQDLLQSTVLPPIIFADLHYNSTNSKIISKLLPKLTKLGYVHYLEEISHDISLEQWSKELDQNMTYIDEYKKEMKAKNLNFERAVDILTHISNQFNEAKKQCDDQFVGNPKYTLAVQLEVEEKLNQKKKREIEQCFDQKLRYDWHLSTKQILTVIKEHKINFVAVDVESKTVEALVQYDHRSISEYKKQIADARSNRDQHMAIKYLEQRIGGVVGRMGLAHIEGVYQQMLENKKPPLVFFIFSQIKLEPDTYNMVKEGLETINPILEKGLTASYIHCLNSDEVSEDIIIDYVIKIVEAKIAKIKFIEALNKLVKSFPSLLKTLGALGAASLTITAIISIFNKKLSVTEGYHDIQQSSPKTSIVNTLFCKPKTFNKPELETESPLILETSEQHKNFKEMPHSRL